MKNLENYGVQELDSVEVQSIEGGNFILELLLEAAIYIIENQDGTNIPGLEVIWVAKCNNLCQ